MPRHSEYTNALHPLRRGIVALCVTTALSPHAASAQSEDSIALEPVVVSTTRTETPVSEITRSVTVVTEEQIQRQAQLDRNLGSILAKTVPGLSPSTQAISSFGQTLRGRDFLVLIDGVPQSTPLRDGARDLNTIDPAVIERIEVVRGGTAAYGFGATGGLINIITKAPSRKSVETYYRAGTGISTEHPDDSVDAEAVHRVSGTEGQWNYLASGTFYKRGGDFDSEGRRIPPNPLGSQGGFSDTDQFDLLGKLGYEFEDGERRLDLTLNHFDVAQDTKYTFGAEGSTLNSDPTPNSRRTPAIRLSQANAGSTNIVTPGTESTLAQVSYSDNRALGGTLDLDTYWGNQSVIYPRFVGFPQGEIASEKLGSRLTLDTPLDWGAGGASVIWGADLLRDETTTSRFGNNASSGVPGMEQLALAAFGELRVPLGESWLVRGGLRHEVIEVDVDDVVNNVGNTVRGGTLEYDETLANLSAVWYVTDAAEIFASASQGFSIADLGRVIRDGGPSGGGATLDAEDFESEANKVDNYELGIRGGDRLRYTLALFRSEADDGTTFDQNLRIQKFSEEIEGIEGTLDYTVNERWLVGGTLSHADGERDSDSGTVDLDNTRISPTKLTLHADYTPGADWEIGTQVMYLDDRDPDTGSDTGFANGEVEGYTLVDLDARIGVGPGDLRLSVQNLFNEDYYPAINQAFNLNTSFAKGPGRTIGASYEMTW